VCALDVLRDWGLLKVGSRAHREALAALMEVLQEEEAWLLVRVWVLGGA
jgi:hypothetical protein